MAALAWNDLLDHHPRMAALVRNDLLFSPVEDLKARNFEEVGTEPRLLGFAAAFFLCGLLMCLGVIIFNRTTGTLIAGHYWHEQRDHFHKEAKKLIHDHWEPSDQVSVYCFGSTLSLGGLTGGHWKLVEENFDKLRRAFEGTDITFHLLESPRPRGCDECCAQLAFGRPAACPVYRPPCFKRKSHVAENCPDPPPEEANAPTVTSVGEHCSEVPPSEFGDCAGGSSS